MYDSPHQMEPLFPSEEEKLVNLSIQVVRNSAALGSKLPPASRSSLTELLRQMNSYYSNLVEGHNTHPLDIERALNQDFSSEPAKRALQLESKAHIEVQRFLEKRMAEDPNVNIVSPEFLQWVHKEFYSRMPQEFRRIVDNGTAYEVVPGELRQRDVQVGRHIPPKSEAVPDFLRRFAAAYEPSKLSELRQIFASAASHHRFAWIHPFLDGNGRVTRLLTHAYFIAAKVDSHGLWTVSRGLARKRDEYMAALAVADEHRQGDFDGRGNLSNRGLLQFCQFFLSTCLDQIEFMSSLLELDGLEKRITAYVEKRASLKELEPESAFLIRDALVRGEIPRGEAPRILGKPERTARRVVSDLVRDGLLVADSHRSALRVGFPTRAVGYYFPRLYPEGVELDLRP